MTVIDTSTAPSAGDPLIGSFAPSPAGPVDGLPLVAPPVIPLPAPIQLARFGRRPLPFLFRARRELGEVFTFDVPIEDRELVITGHPDHAKSLFTAKPDLVPSMTAESPLRPIMGEGVLTTNGDRHMRQRKLLLPPFHGEAIKQYEAMIEATIHRELDRWKQGDTFRLAERMQAVTLDVIMAGIFGVEGEPPEGSTERRLRDMTRRALSMSEKPWFVPLELRNLGRTEPVGLLKRLIDAVDRHYYQLIRERRAQPEAERGTDILSLLLSVTDEDGVLLTDHEIRDELITLVLAGHETTANQLAWAFERLTRTPAAHATLRDLVRRDDEGAGAYVEATIHEAMRARPVIPLVGRHVTSDWQLGEYVVPAGTRISVAIILVHHREDLYPQPFAFRPERFLATKPGTYTWIPFGGGTRRCLGAALAMAEMRIVLRAITERMDLEAPDPTPEREQHRNVTLLPGRGGQVTVARRLS
ncbi:cytochrome P450 [Paraconexibacter sp.]|uniref:cytochrome P450 n=1 Tax=Paraconexibacter sp. TaxID=2949640 RepID=UPI003564B382